MGNITLHFVQSEVLTPISRSAIYGANTEISTHHQYQITWTPELPRLCCAFFKSKSRPLGKRRVSILLYWTALADVQCLRISQVSPRFLQLSVKISDYPNTGPSPALSIKIVAGAHFCASINDKLQSNLYSKMSKKHLAALQRY